MSNNYTVFPQQPTISANRAADIAIIQQKIANMSPSEYLSYMQKLRNKVLAGQSLHMENAQQYQPQQQQQYNPSELLLSNINQLPAQQPQPFQSLLYPTSQPQQASSPDTSSTSQLPSNHTLTNQQVQAVTQFLNSLKTGQTQFSQPSFQSFSGSSISRPLLTSSWFPQSPTQTPPDNYLQSLHANNSAMMNNAIPEFNQPLSVTLSQDQQLHWSNVLAMPIFPSDPSDTSDQMLKYKPPAGSSTLLSVPRDISSFPSPASAYTPSPALTAFESNFSEYDPHEESIFPLSENTSPLTSFQAEPQLLSSAYEPGELLFDPAFKPKASLNTLENVPELSTTSPRVDSIKLENSESYFSPVSGFAVLNIENNTEPEFPLFTNLFQSDLSRTHSHELDKQAPFVKIEERSWDEEDESSSLISDEQEVPRVKKEPRYFDDDYDEESTEDIDEDIFMHAQYGQKSLPTTKVKPEPIDDDTYESADDGSVDDEDFEMKSESESEPDYLTSSDDDFVGTRGRSMRGRRKSSTPNSDKISKSSSGTFVCPTCSRDFNRRFNLLTHLKTHDINRPRPFICPNCNANFVRQHDLTRHASVHATTKPHKCPGCGTEFSRRDAMLRHVMQRSKCFRAAEKAEKEALEKLKDDGENAGLSAAAAGLSRGRGRRRKSDGMSIQKTEIQLLHEDPEAKKVIEEAFRMQRELKKKK